MIRRLISLLVVIVGLCAPVFAAEPVTRERLSMDRGWLFHLGEVPFPLIQGHGPTYSNAKAGQAWGAAAQGYDDSAWREVRLPHDWAVEGPFDQKENLSQGYRPRGIGWYRRHFKIPGADKGRHLELQFDGVVTHCTVWVNGLLVHRNWCGYTSFSIDITPFAKYGESLNTVAIRVDANAMEGWWYEGAGIYRHTWLVKRNPVYVVTDGLFAQPVKGAATAAPAPTSASADGGSWTIPVEVTLNNSGKDASPVEIEATLIDPKGKEVARTSMKATVPSLEETVVKSTIPLTSPQLWSVAYPTLYTVRTVVKSEGKPVDEVTTTCGFRTIRFDADKGFFLNDISLKLKGVCDHQDHAGVGVAMPDALWEFRLRRLKAMGVNAYRCAHNPPSTEFLNLCDRMGMLVMDENRNFNSTPEYQRQLEWLIRRDRNHPSVILWSVFNEEPMQGSESGYEMVRRMKAVVNRLDTTRPVTAAMNGGIFSPSNVSKTVDVVGFNYQPGSYDRFHKENPTLPMTSSEDTSAFMTRGEYQNKANVKESYDTQRAPWGATHREGWKAIAERPYLAGGFVWTGFDYRGEPTPFQWPSAGSFFGCMDLCGFPKAAFYINQAMWIEDKPILQLIPHWNWPGREGKPVKVMALTNADTVEINLNGKSLGEKQVAKYDMVSWDVPYEPGRLEAVAKKGGKEVARFAVETTGDPVSLQLLPDRPALAGDGWDAQPITVQALDAQGRPVPTANLMVDFEIEGQGNIIGLGNGDPNCHEPEKGNKRSLFNGLAQIIVQTQPGTSNALKLRAKSAGLKTGEATIKVETSAVRPYVERAAAVLTLQSWRMSAVTATAPDPNQAVEDNDMNSWAPVEPGKLQPFPDGNFAVYRTKFQPGAVFRQNGGTLQLRKVTGKAEVWLDGKLLTKKDKQEPADIKTAFPPGEGERTLSVLIETTAASPAGLNGCVTIDAKNL